MAKPTAASARETRSSSGEAWESWRGSSTTYASRRALHTVSPASLIRRAESYSQRWRRGSSSGRFRNTRASAERRRDSTRGTLSEAGARVGRRRRLDRERDDVGAANNGQAEGSLLLRFDGLIVAGAGGSDLVLLSLDASELFGVGEHEIHVL